MEVARKCLRAFFKYFWVTFEVGLIVVVGLLAVCHLLGVGNTTVGNLRLNLAEPKAVIYFGFMTPWVSDMVDDLLSKRYGFWTIDVQRMLRKRLRRQCRLIAVAAIVGIFALGRMIHFCNPALLNQPAHILNVIIDYVAMLFFLGFAIPMPRPQDESDELVCWAEDEECEEEDKDTDC